MTREIMHWAYCPATGEVLGNATSNSLKRHVRRVTNWHIRYGCPVCEWRFFHGSEHQFRVHCEKRG